MKWKKFLSLETVVKTLEFLEDASDKHTFLFKDNKPKTIRNVLNEIKVDITP